MPSSSKTPHLSLNAWLGSDKPKKDDFNADNQLVDTAVGRIADRLDALEAGSGSVELPPQLLEHLDDGARHLSPAERNALPGVLSHSTDGNIHVTLEEKAKWNSAGSGGGGSEPVIGTYAGDGMPSQRIPLGFEPRYGFLFATGYGPAEAEWDGRETKTYSGFFSSRGSNRYITTAADGLTVNNTNRGASGNSYKYNESGITYVYVAWR